MNKETAFSPEIFQNINSENKATFSNFYEESFKNPDKFWEQQANEFITWDKKWNKISDCDFSKGKISWFEGAKLNACYNCLDRHIPKYQNKTAIIWEGNKPTESKKITYEELYLEVCRFANVLKYLGVNKGDTVCIYLPMIPEIAVATLACARIGAVHSIVFAGFSPEALKTRITDGKSKIVITANEGLRGDKHIPLKANVDEAIKELNQVENVIVVQRTENKINWNDNRDSWYHDLMKNSSSKSTPEIVDAEDPLFILYTSGSTGKPKGVVHTTGGYMLYAAFTHKFVFDYQDSDIYWCTADFGWITGHSYSLYGPLANAATTVMFEGIPNYPDYSRLWQIVDKYKITTFYTAPTLIRALIAAGDDFVTRCNRSSLRILGTVGEPINPEVWLWYFNVVGNKKLPVVDTWWQTETGGIIISPIPGVSKLKAGSAATPLPGIKACILDKDGKELKGEGKGILVLKNSWPGQTRTIYGDHQRFMETYFNPYKGYYFTGDGASIDSDGYFWITGRIDDVINVSGHRIGTAEIESALVLNAKVAEAAVVGKFHKIKGKCIYCFVKLNHGEKQSDELKKELIKLVRAEIGPFAAPEEIQFVSDLPKTRSGKIMRRILRKIVNNEIDDLGDISTLAEKDIIEELITNSQKLNNKQ